MDPVQETQARWLLKKGMQWEIYYPDDLRNNPVNVAELEKHVTITSGAVWVTKMREYFEPIVTKEKQMKLKIGEELPLKVLEQSAAHRGPALDPLPAPRPPSRSPFPPLS